MDNDLYCDSVRIQCDLARDFQKKLLQYKKTRALKSRHKLLLVLVMRVEMFSLSSFVNNIPRDCHEIKKKNTNDEKKVVSRIVIFLVIHNQY